MRDSNFGTSEIRYPNGFQRVPTHHESFHSNVDADPGGGLRHFADAHGGSLGRVTRVQRAQRLASLPGDAAAAAGLSKPGAISQHAVQPGSLG